MQICTITFPFWRASASDFHNSTSDLKRNTFNKALGIQPVSKQSYTIVLRTFFSCFAYTHKTNTGVLIFYCYVTNYHKFSSLEQHPFIRSQSCLWPGCLGSHNVEIKMSVGFALSNICGPVPGSLRFQAELSSLRLNLCPCFFLAIRGLTQF